MPKLKIGEIQTYKNSSMHNLTPRTPSTELTTEEQTKYPIFQAYTFTEAINHKKIRIVSAMINDSTVLQSYQPAIHMRNTLKGEINPNSPFYNQETWQNCDENSPINKVNYKSATLHLLESQATTSLRHAHKVSIAYKHIRNIS